MTTLDEADGVWARYPELPRTYIDARVAAVILKLEARLAAAERATRCPGCGMMHAPHDFGRCARCGQSLDNLTTVISIVADSTRICAACLRPDDSEIARVRGL